MVLGDSTAGKVFAMSANDLSQNTHLKKKKTVLVACISNPWKKRQVDRSLGLDGRPDLLDESQTSDRLVSS